jgi:hypothetical protein
MLPNNAQEPNSSLLSTGGLPGCQPKQLSSGRSWMPPTRQLTALALWLLHHLHITLLPITSSSNSSLHPLFRVTTTASYSNITSACFGLLCSWCRLYATPAIRDNTEPPGSSFFWFLVLMGGSLSKNSYLGTMAAIFCLDSLSFSRPLSGILSSFFSMLPPRISPSYSPCLPVPGPFSPMASPPTWL